MSHYSPLFSRLVAIVCDSTWGTCFLEHVFEYPMKWCVYSTDMVDATWKCCHLGMFCVHHTTMHHVISCNATTFHVCMFSCNLPPALLVEWLGYVHATAVTQGWNGYQNKSQHRKLTLEKKILPLLLPGFKPETFWSQVRESRDSTIELSPLLAND